MALSEVAIGTEHARVDGEKMGDWTQKMCLKHDNGLAAAISHSLGESGKFRHSAKVLTLAENSTDDTPP